MRLLPTSISPSAHRQAEEFARLLDGQSRPANPQLQPLVTLAASLRPAPLSPRPQFRDELRATLVEQAAARPPAAVPAPRAHGGGEPGWGTPRPHRFRTAIATTLTAALIGGAGAAWASSHALPGDALYGLKRGLENVQLDLARGDTAKGREHLEQAERRLGEAEALAAGEDARSPQNRSRIAGALADMDTAAAAGTNELLAAYADTGDAEPLRLLDRFAAEQRERLADLAALLDPALRARVRSLADALRDLQARVEALLPAGSTTGVAALGPVGSLAAARESGDGWAVARAVDRLAGVTGPVPTAAAAGAPLAAAGGAAAPSGAAKGGGGVGSVVDDVGKVVGGVTGSTSGGGASAPGVPLPTVTLPPVGSSTPLPTVTLPTVPVPQVSVPPLPSASVPLPSVSLPAASSTGLPCVPLPPATHC